VQQGREPLITENVQIADQKFTQTETSDGWAIKTSNPLKLEDPTSLV